MRTISNLYNEGDTVFICFENETIGKKFLQDAEKEGFLINGELPPATGNTSKIYLLKKRIHHTPDFRLCYAYIFRKRSENQQR